MDVPFLNVFVGTDILQHIAWYITTFVSVIGDEHGRDKNSIHVDVMISVI